jgi:arylsulfatase/uncharacterized sulfatase
MSNVFIRRPVAFLALWFFSLGMVAHAAGPKAPPNIVVLVADDWGFTDVGAYGSEISTPHIDALAKRGAKFSNFHTASVCSPTRAMLLTGVDNHRNGVGNMPETTPAAHEGKPGYEGVLNDRAVTLATLLKDRGYHTYITGKWHLGKTPSTLPGKRGFERSFIQADSGSDNWENRTYMMLYDKAYWFEQDKEVQLPKDFYSSTLFVDKAMDFIDAGRADGKPFFTYIGFQANHIPLQAPKALVDKYKGRYDAGWAVLRQERHARAVALGLIPKGSPMVSLASTLDWNTLSADEKREHAKHMEVYAAMAEAMDHEIGRLVSHLKARRQFDNTVFVFLSDNGSDPADPLNIAASRAYVRMHYDTQAQALGAKGTFVANGPSWASATVSPLQGYKYFAGEGGLRVPLVISGIPGMTKDHLSLAFTHVTDIVPTLLEAVGIPNHQGNYQGTAVEPLIGRSMLPMLLGQVKTVHSADQPIGYELAGSAALFKGDYKLVKNIAPLGDGQWRLYHLLADPGEVRDIATTEPERFKTMLADYEAYALANGVLPIPKDFDLQKNALRFGIQHFLIPKLHTIAPWVALVLVVLIGGWVQMRRRARRKPST